MSAAPIPFNEAGRKRVLDALNVLDTLPEAFSDVVASAAAAIANVPISAISLVDTERQWFKSACGLDAQQTSRDVSFCAHAILQAGPLVVPDTLADARFRDNPCVTGAPFMRFYAGFPLVVSGHAVGALCVVDDRPRELAAYTVERLSKLAAGTSLWLADRGALEGALHVAREELRQANFHDAVTGLPNRAVFQERLKQAAARCDRTAGSFAVLSIDLDGFKVFNDAWGEALGDKALREVGQRLAALVRPTDTVACAGGDRFLVMADGLSKVETVVRLAQRVGATLGLPLDVGDRDTRLTASIGVALYPADGPRERLVPNADAAMGCVKQEGGNDCRFFELRMNAEARARADLIGDLRSAVERGQLELHYQPKIHAGSGLVSGVEALVRWHRPGHGPVSPAVFIPLAERAGFINAMGRWVVGEACRQMRAWRDAGIPMRVAINLSVHQLRQPDIAEEIAAALAGAGVEPALLTCEITESVAMDDATAALDVFARLKATGVQLSIDDFGTGYSSLSYLRKLPVHQLKIDRSFVTDLADSEDARAVAAAIVNLAHALRLEVVAEGVETTAQRDILSGLGCDKFQGYLFARPMSAEAFTSWVSNRDRHWR